MRVDSERRFLFISLEEVNEGRSFDFITPSGEKLKLNKKSYDIRTIKFNNSSEGFIKAVNENDKYYFYPLHFSDEQSEKLEWLFDLKDLHAQRIVSNYCATLSRVGLDESEWLRLNQI
jgi:hypothetical protein